MSRTISRWVMYAFVGGIVLGISTARVWAEEPLKVGERYPLKVDSSKAVNDVAVEATSSGFRYEWTHPGATYIAVHFKKFDLAPGDELIISDASGGQAFRHSGLGKMDLGTFWAQHVKGDTVVVELKTTNAKPGKGFVIDEYAAGFVDLGGPPVTEEICGANDLQNAACRNPSTEYTRGRAVARLLIQGTSLCTGWLASATNHLITNEHCISSATAAANTDYEFGSEAPSCGSANCQLCFPGTIYSGATFIKDNPGLDYALVRITSGNPQATFGFLQIDNRVAVVGEQIYLVSHPAGRAKEFAYNSTGDAGGVGRVLSLNEPSCSGATLEVGYHNDTEGGSSGSPVIAVSSQKVIVLHHCRGNALGCGDPNRGVPINQICSDIGGGFCSTCTTNADCNDANACTTDTCSGGVCSNVAITCDDGNACTANSCNPATGCVFTGGICNGQTCAACPGDCSALVSPADAASGVAVSASLDWTDLTGATGYDVQVATDAGFTNVVRSGSFSVSAWVVSPALANATTYFWRVRATAACGAGSWTNARTFTTDASGYLDCGTSCVNLATGAPVTASGLWNFGTNPASKVNDTNTGTTSLCEGATGYCAIASNSSGGQGIGNYLQLDLGAIMSVKSVTVYGRRDTALSQGQNLNLKTSTDGTNWTTNFMANTTSASGHTVPTARLARYVRVETTTAVYLSLYEIVVSGVGPYLDCGTDCSNLALGKTATASGLWDPVGNPASKANDGNTGTNPLCEHAPGFCAIASDTGGGQAIGNYLQIDLGAIRSVKSVTVYGRRDFALTQGQNLNLKTSTDGTNWTTNFMADTTSPSGHTVPTARLARYVRVETTTVVYLSLYEIVVTGKGYVDCGGSCSNLAIGKTASASGLWNPSGNPASKVNDTNTGTNPLCEGASGFCAIASTSGGLQAIGNYLQIDLGSVMSVKSVTVYGRRDAALGQAKNLNLTLSDGGGGTLTFIADATSSSGATVATARLARYIKVDITTVNYLSLYEIVVTGGP